MKYQDMVKACKEIEKYYRRIEFLEGIFCMEPKYITLTEGDSTKGEQILNTNKDSEMIGFTQEIIASIKSLCEEHIKIARQQISFIEGGINHP